MNHFVVAALGAMGILSVGASVIYYLQSPKTNCIDEVIEITNASNVPMAVLLAPQPALDTLKPALSTKTTTDKIDNVIVAGGVVHDVSVAMVFLKVLVDEDTHQEDPVLKQVESALHKQPHQCGLNGKNYNIYMGKTIMSIE